jgi:hypothetical protein
MSTLTLENAFIGKATAPTDKELADVLGGDSKTLWDKLIIEISAAAGANVPEWNSYSLKHGWSLRLKAKKRNIVYLIPHNNGFQVTFILGDKAIKAAREAGLPAKVLKIMDAAPKYPEGTGVRIEVSRASDLPAILKLAEIKAKN